MSKLILITGVSKGLGRVMTETFIQSGHTVIGCSLNKEAIATLEKQFGAPHHFTAVDIADEMQVKNWSQVISSKYDAPDLIINNN